MCLKVKRVEKKPLRRTAWKVVQPNRDALHYPQRPNFYRKGRTVVVDRKKIANPEIYWSIHYGLHVYTDKRIASSRSWKVIKVRVSPKDWVADGLDGDAVYSKLTVLT